VTTRIHSSSRRIRVTITNLVLLLATLTLAPPQAAPQDAKPLPDRTNFLIEFQVKRPGLYRLAGAMADINAESKYTYTETITEISLDSDGRTKSTQQQVVEYIPTHLAGFIYERQTVKNGVPLTLKELDRQDRKHQENLAKAELTRQKWIDGAPQRAEDAKLEKEKQRQQFEKKLAANLDRQNLSGEARKAREREERETFEKIISGENKPTPAMSNSPILNVADFQLVRREIIDGHPTILLSFQPNPKYKGPTGDIEKMFQHTTGYVWVSEDDYQPVKIDLEVKDAIKFGLGLLAKIQPGSRGTFEWRKINNEVWLPYRQNFSAKVRILLVKGENIREIHEYSDHKKYVVSTEIRVDLR